MRLTNHLIAKNYLANLNDSMSALNGINERVSASRKYMKASEDPAGALKALQVRKNLSRIGLYKENILSAQDMLREKETALSTINDIVGNAVTQVLQGKSDTYSADSRKIIADTIRNYQEQILTTANSKFSDKYIFGGTDVKNIPFTLDTDGSLLYHGQNVDTGTFTKETRYLDIGMGISTDASGTVIPQTAFDAASSGIDLLGSGTDANGLPNNLYNLLGEIADRLETNNMTDIGQLSGKLEVCQKNIILQYTGIGEKNRFTEFLNTRFENDETITMEKQNNLEVLETAKGIIDYNEQELAYNACLQMGLKIMQPSLLDYLS